VLSLATRCDVDDPSGDASASETGAIARAFGGATVLALGSKASPVVRGHKCARRSEEHVARARHIREKKLLEAKVVAARAESHEARTSLQLQAAETKPATSKLPQEQLALVKLAVACEPTVRGHGKWAAQANAAAAVVKVVRSLQAKTRREMLLEAADSSPKGWEASLRMPKAAAVRIFVYCHQWDETKQRLRAYVWSRHLRTSHAQASKQVMMHVASMHNDSLAW